MSTTIRRRFLTHCTLALLVGSLGSATCAFAKPKAEANGKRPAANGSKREQVLAQFDANGNGKLDPDEMAAARKAAAERRKNKQLGNGDAGEGQLPGGPQGLDGLNGAAPGAGAGPRGDGRAKMMEKFDLDGDGQLSQEEQARMKQFMQQNGMGPFGQGGIAGPGMRGPGMGGPGFGGGQPGGKGFGPGGPQGQRFPQGQFPPGQFPGGQQRKFKQ